MSWFRILDLGFLLGSSKGSEDGVSDSPLFRDTRPVNLPYTYERVGLHQCFPECGMRQVNKMLLGGIAPA